MKLFLIKYFFSPLLIVFFLSLSSLPQASAGFTNFGTISEIYVGEGGWIMVQLSGTPYYNPGGCAVESGIPYYALNKSHPDFKEVYAAILTAHMTRSSTVELWIAEGAGDCVGQYNSYPRIATIRFRF